MFEQFAGSARTTVSSAMEEVRLRGDRRLGTEHLLLGVLHDRDSDAVQSLGADLAAARTALDTLDRDALTAIGIAVEGVERTKAPASRKRTPFTSAARSVLQRALAEARGVRARRIEATHLLLAILDCERSDPAAELLAQLGIDRMAASSDIRALVSRA